MNSSIFYFVKKRVKRWQNLYKKIVILFFQKFDFGEQFRSEKNIID